MIPIGTSKGLKDQNSFKPSSFLSQLLCPLQFSLSADLLHFCPCWAQRSRAKSRKPHGTAMVRMRNPQIAGFIPSLCRFWEPPVSWPVKIQPPQPQRRPQHQPPLFQDQPQQWTVQLLFSLHTCCRVEWFQPLMASASPQLLDSSYPPTPGSTSRFCSCLAEALKPGKAVFSGNQSRTKSWNNPALWLKIRQLESPIRLSSLIKMCFHKYAVWSNYGEFHFNPLLELHI